MKKLSQRERVMVQCYGIPAKQVAVAMRMTVNEVLEMQEDLKCRGLMPQDPANAERRRGGQLGFEAIDQMMRTNSAPAARPTERGELWAHGWEGW